MFMEPDTLGNNSAQNKLCLSFYAAPFLVGGDRKKKKIKIYHEEK